MEPYEIVPLAAIGPFRLGLPRAHAQQLLSALPDFASAPDGVGYGRGRDRRGCVELTYDADVDTVVGVEVFWGGSVEPTIGGRPVFSRGVEVVVAELAGRSRFVPDDYQTGCVCLFPEWELRFWRPAPADSAEDFDRRHYWSVAIGVKGFFTAGHAQTLAVADPPETAGR